MRNIPRSAAALFSLLFFAEVRAAEAAPLPLPTDPVLARLIEESLSARPEIPESEAALRAERERIPQAGALPDPVLSLGIRNNGFGGIQVGKMDTSFYQVMLSQGLPWPGKRGLRTDVARLAASQAEANVIRLRLSTEADVRRAYLDLLVVRERSELLDRLGSIRFQSGMAAQSDVLRAQLELNRIRVRRWTLQAEEAIRLQALNRLRGHPLDESIATTARVRDIPVPAVFALGEAIADAEARSPELAAARFGVAREEARVDLARRERFPDLSAHVGVMPRGGLEPLWTAGVSVGLPIWSSRKQGRAVAEGTARSAASTLGAEAVSQILRLRVADRRAGLLALTDTIRLYRESLLAQSRAILESTLALYRVGRVTFASVLEANAGYIGDEEGHLLAVADALRVAIASAEVSLDPVVVAGGGGGTGSRGSAAAPASAPSASDSDM